MGDPVARLLARRPAVVLDGALATELERRGCDLRDPLWSARLLLDARERIREVHLDYFRAGADCATTATYQASVPGFARRGLGVEDSGRLIALAVRLAREARAEFRASARDAGQPAPFIAGSVGPYGAYLADGSEYRGDYRLSETDLADFHRPRIAALAEAGVDMIACETLPCIAEARALLHLLEAEFTGLHAWFTFTTRDAARIASGEAFSEALTLFAGHRQVAAVGVNCTAPRFVETLVARARTLVDKPIAAYPNSGEVYDAVGKRWGEAPEGIDLAALAPAWYRAGARLIGGCCRTGPADIAALAAWARAVGFGRER